MSEDIRPRERLLATDNPKLVGRYAGQLVFIM